MKKVLPFIALVGLLLLSGCGTDMKKILTADGGKWEGTGFGVSTQFTFYKDGEVSLLAVSYTHLTLPTTPYV